MDLGPAFFIRHVFCVYFLLFCYIFLGGPYYVGLFSAWAKEIPDLNKGYIGKIYDKVIISTKFLTYSF